MAPRKATIKRPASFAIHEAPAKKTKRCAGGGGGGPGGGDQSSFAKECASIAQVIQEAPGYPEDVIKMLSTCVKDALSLPKETRHHTQHRMIEMTKEVLESAEESAHQYMQELEMKVANADHEKIAREEAVEAAKADVGEKAKAVEAAKLAEVEADDYIVRTKHEKAEAEGAQERFNKECEKSGARKSSIEAMWEGDFKALTLGATTDFPKAMRRFLKFGKDHAFDENLLLTVQQVLSTSPDDRSKFDEKVLKQIDDEFSTAIARETDFMKAGEAERASHGQKVQRAKTAAEAAIEHRRAKANDLYHAEWALDEAKSHKKAADRSKKAHCSEMQHAWDNVAAATEKHRQVAGVVQTFQGLVERCEEYATNSTESWSSGWQNWGRYGNSNLSSSYSWDGQWQDAA